jgi:tetratricopeptide (TPR) repeat protein
MRPIALALLALLGSPRVALGEGALERDAARALFEEGRIAFEKARYAEALERMERAYSLAPIPDLLYDIARCHEQLGHTADAISAYERYVALAPPSQEREVVTRHVAGLRAYQLLRAAGNAPRRPVYRRWWFWTTLGLAVGAAIGVGVGVGVAGSGADSRTFPALRASM